MSKYEKKIEGQCGTCAHALDFGYGSSPSGPEDGVHCDSLELAKSQDKQNNSTEPEYADLVDFNQKELAQYGFMDLFRLECLAEDTYRCDFWQPSKAWLSQKELNIG